MGKRKDLIFGTSVVESFPAGTTSGSGTPVDGIRTYAQKHIVSCDAFTSDITVRLEESDSSGSGYTNVAPAKMVGGVNSFVITSTGKLQIAGFGLKRYQRLSIVSGSGTLSADAVLANDLGN